jgi:subtilisin family serine protease
VFLTPGRSAGNVDRLQFAVAAPNLVGLVRIDDRRSTFPSEGCMRPTRSLEVRRLDACLHFDSLEERLTPATADPWTTVIDSQVVSNVAGDPYANATPIVAANLQQVRQAFPNTTGAGYSIAVLDTGVDYNHPALGGGFGAGYKVVGGFNFVDNTIPGFVSGIPRGPNPMDESGHGTNVAGIAAAKNATYGGVAPDANIIALRVLDKNGHGSWGWIEDALQWVIDNRAKYNIAAVNMSLGGGNYTGLTSDFQNIQSKLQTLWNAGVVNVASAGNNFYQNGSVAGLQFPAISEWAVSVGATFDGNYGSRSWAGGAVDHVTYADKIAAFSQRSKDLDLLAPGAIITSTGLSNGGNANYVSYAGSSQSSPFVAAAAVLVKEALVESGQGSLATAQYIVDILHSSGVPITDNKPASEDNVGRTGLTFPRLNILAALQKAVGGSSTSPDQYETNETMGAAKFLGYLGTSNTFSGLTYHATNDNDWYSFIATTPGTYRIQTPVGAGMSAPSLTFYDVTKNANRTIYATVVNGVATIDVSLRDKVRYFLHTKAFNGQRGAYQLTLQNNSSAGAPPASDPDPDRYETNESQAAAKFVGYMGNATVSDLTIHQPSDLDWFRFQSTVQTTQQIRVIADGNPGKATFTFYDVSKNNPRTVPATFVNGVATVNVSLRTGVNYFLKVHGVNGAIAPYRLVFGSGSSGSSLEADLVDRALADLI